MDSKQNLYYALGELCYAMAKSDGSVQEEEKRMIKEIMEERSDDDIDFDIAEIIFNILGKENIDFETTYKWALKEMKLSSNHLNPERKKTFVEIIRKVAEAFPPVTDEEQKVIDRFEKDLEQIG